MTQSNEAAAKSMRRGGLCADAAQMNTLRPGLFSWLLGTLKQLSQRIALLKQREKFNPREQLSLVGERMLRRSQRAQQSLSVLVLEVPQLLEVRSRLGTEAARRVVEAITLQLDNLASTTGWAGRTAQTGFTVLLPCADRGEALAAIRDALDWPCRIEMEVNGQALSLVPDVRLATLGRDSRSVEETYASMRRDIAQERGRAAVRLQREVQTKELRRRHSLQRERKRQLLLTEQEVDRRRMEAMASTARGFCATVPATIPATIPLPVNPR